MVPWSLRFIKRSSSRRTPQCNSLVTCGMLTLVGSLALAELPSASAFGRSSGQDYYSLLGLRRGDHLTDAILKKAYRKAARQYHPDVNKSPEANDLFVKITKAYETLSDPNMKQIYDQYGEEGLDGRQQAGNGFHEGFHFPTFDFHSHFPSGFPDFGFFSDDGDDSGQPNGGGSHFESFDTFFGDDDLLSGGFTGHRSAFRSLNSQFRTNTRASSFHQHQSFNGGGGGQRCVTTTQRNGNSVFTRTVCS